jgi:hypothetical protein
MSIITVYIHLLQLTVENIGRMGIDFSVNKIITAQDLH